MLKRLCQEGNVETSTVSKKYCNFFYLNRTVEREITVRSAAEMRHSSSARENVPDGKWGHAGNSDVTKFQEEIKIAQKTTATPHVPWEAQMVPMMTRSKVQNIPMPDLKQTAAQSSGSMLQISSRRAWERMR